MKAHAGFLVMLAGSAGIRLAAVYGLVGDAEPTLWLFLSLAGSMVFVRTREHPPRYAFPATALAALASPLLQAALLPVQLARDPAAAAALRNLPGGLSPRAFVLLTGPLVAIAYAGVTTLITLVLTRVTRRRETGPE